MISMEVAKLDERDDGPVKKAVEDVEEEDVGDIEVDKVEMEEEEEEVKIKCEEEEEEKPPNFCGEVKSAPTPFLPSPQPPQPPSGAAVATSTPPTSPPSSSPASSPPSSGTPATVTSASPPILFQPFLPSPISPAAAAAKPLLPGVNHHHRSPALPFSIDNILKPTFGQQLLLHRMAAAAAAVAAAAKNGSAPGGGNLLQQQLDPSSRSRLPLGHHHQLPSPHHLPPANAAASHSPSSSAAGGGILSRQEIKREPPPSPSPGHNNNNLPSSHHHQPVDLSRQAKEAAGGPDGKEGKKNGDGKDGDVPPGMVRGPNGQLWPAWVFCTRYSDRPSSGPRLRKVKKAEKTPQDKSSKEKRPRTAFNADQLGRLRREFEENRYLTEERRRNLATELGLNENQIKIWFQNKRAKIKKTSGNKGELAQMLAAQGLYNHSTIPVDEDEFPNL